MHRKFKKIASAVVAASMLLSSCMTGIAEEQAVTETALKEAAAEAPAEAPQTEAPTEAPQTEAPTEAPQTEAPAEAPQTEAPTEAPQTEAPAEAPQTEAPAEAPQTEAPAEAPQTEAPTEEDKETETEKETKPEKKEDETERSERKNDGRKMSSSDLASKLSGALPYLFAAESVDGPEEILEGQSIAEGAQGQAVISALGNFSVELANARSSSDVGIINLYADKNGKIDTAQLDKAFKNHVIDVTKKYYVVNVIADSENQSLSFSGYDMVDSGQTVVYGDAAQAGDILYNFAAVDGDGFTGYAGTVTLSGREELQGTFLAPEAAVNVGADLAGAVYADAVNVEDSVDELLQIVFVKGGGKAAEAGTEAEPLSETAAEPQTEGAAETETEEEPAAETEPEEALEITEGTEEEVVDVVDLMADVPSEQMAVPAAFRVGIIDTEKGTTLTDGTVSVKAAEDITGTDGVKIHSKDAAIEGAVDGNGNITLTNSGRYYLEMSQVPAGYYGVSRIYFSIDGQGAPAFDLAADGGLNWDADTKVLTIALYSESSKPNGVPILNVTDGNGKQINGAAFALYAVDDAAAKVVGYIDYAGKQVALNGLAAGNYRLSQLKTEAGYQIVPDNDASMSFTVAADPVAVDITNAAKPSGGKTVEVTAQTFYNDVLLSADEEVSTKLYAALFTGTENPVRVSEVQELVYEKDAQSSLAAAFTGLSESSYYAAATDELGVPVSNEEYQVAQAKADFAENESAKTVRLNYQYPAEASYPAGFYYMVPVALAKNVLGYDGKALSVSENFYAELYSDAALAQKLTAAPITFSLNKASSAQGTPVQVKMTAASGIIYVAETDQSGNALGNDFKYTVTYPGTNGAIAVSCKTKQGTNEAEPVTAAIQNKLNSSVVKLRIIDASTKEALSGATLVLKDSKGKVIKVNSTTAFTSQKSDIVLTNRLAEGETYSLSEVNAPSGYTPSPDVSFTVKTGETTEVVMENSKTVSSDYQITVTKQVYSGKYPVYARDVTAGTYAAEGRYTFYAALFADAARTQKVSNVQKITVSGFGGTTAFTNLKRNTTYYVGETNEYGEVVASTSSLTVQYANNGRVATSGNNQTTTIQNVYSSLPRGYRYTGTLTITKHVKSSSGEAEQVTDTFYAGIFRKADYSDTPTIVKLDLKNASSVSAQPRRILLSGNNDMTYYIAEVDASGKRVNEETFGYSVSIDQPSVTIKKGEDKTVNITNQTKSSKVTLYITKRVYKGTALQAVNSTFYAGLFKDEKFTQLYTKPIPLNMNGKSELTLKLSLNLGTASNAKIYVAEVDQNGQIIKNEQSFGYEIKLVNSTAEFTQGKREHQAVLINSVYGTVTKDDWNKILSQDGNNLGSGEVVSGNGEAAAAAQTADDTPIFRYLLLMAASFVILVGYRRRKRI